MQKTGKNSVKTSVSAITKRRKSGRKWVQKLKNPPPSQATCGTAKKNVANQKIEVKKLKNTFFFSLFAFRFWTGAFTNRSSPYCFFQCFLKASVTPYQKHRVLAEKCPPPGKPVTFYECHLEDHAPAPSVRADFMLVLCNALRWWLPHVGVQEHKVNCNAIQWNVMWNNIYTGMIIAADTSMCIYPCCLI